MFIETIDFPFLRLLFECRVSGPLLHFTSRRGETIKGLIAGEMKKLFPCSLQASCERCKIVEPGSCEYVRFFRFDLCRSPFSYVIIPPLNPRSVYCENETFNFEIRLFGECARFDYVIKYLTPAIEQGGLLTGMGTWYKDQKQHFGRFQLNGVHAWQNGDWKRIFKEADGFIDGNISAVSFLAQLSQDEEEYRRLQFYTPFCLKKGRDFVAEPTVADIIYFSIMRLRAITGNRSARISDADYEKTGLIRILSAQFEKTFTEKQLSYSIGNLEFDSLPRELVPVLQLGSFCHIGKGITQGYGGFFLIS